MTVEILLTRGLVTLVDDEDAEWLGQWKWHASSRVDGRAYAVRQLSPKRGLLMHRAIMRPDAGIFIDHIDGNGLNNQRANLRYATNTENLRNRRMAKSNKCGYKGVSLHGNRFRAQISADGRWFFIGSFKTPEEAHAAYCGAARRLHGEFARFE